MNVRILLLAAAPWVLALATVSTARAAPNDADDPKWCRTCHEEPKFSAAMHKKSAHVDQTCRDCHQTYQFNPHEEIEEPKGAEFDALKKRGMKVPEALASCTECHDSPSDVPGAFPHGDDKVGTKAGMPYCQDCHGDAHEIVLAEKLPKAERRLKMNDRCVACHSDAKKMDAAHQRSDIVKEYEHSMHFRKLALGSPDAPGCADCHPAHPPKNDKEKQALAAGPCVKCHDGADPKFGQLADHRPVTAEERPVSYWTLKFFAWLTFLTIFALSMHVLLDLFGTIRRAGKPAPHPTKPDVDPDALAKVSEGRVEKSGTVLRFDLHQRLAHGLMATSFTLLVLTGWPLSTHGIGASRVLVSVFGGLQGIGLAHRVAAVGLILAAVYHLGYLIAKAARGQLKLTMAPLPRDLRDVLDNLKFFMGMRKDKPRFARFTYFEKFDYWAVFWGCVIMVGSGAVRWFPTETMKWAPTWLYEVAYVAHTDEALLAGLAIFVWHFYNVHLRPAVFPMSWVFLTGRMTAEEHAEEHAAEHDAWVAAAKAKAAADEAARQAEEATRQAEEAAAAERRAS